MSEMPLDITAILDEHVARLEEPREPDGKYHPSSMWGCDRKVIYELRGVEKSNPPDATSSRRFRIGHILHAFLQSAIAETSSVVRVYSEFSTKDDRLNITGHGDVLVELNTGMFVVVEAKSRRASGLKFGLDEDHAKQGSTYAVEARTVGVWVTDDEGNDKFLPPLGETLIGVIVYYMEKEDLLTQGHYIPYDESWETRLDERVASLDRYRNDPESLPPRLPMIRGKPDWHCKWKTGQCDFYTRCWTQDGSAIEPVESGEFDW